MSKAYQLGIIVGRFQSFHNGHKYMIDKAIELCDEVGIFVGSSQESGTERNPYSYQTRERLLLKQYGDKISVFPLPDVGYGNNCKWGSYVIDNVLSRFGRAPDIFISGKEDRRINWFSEIEGDSVAELYVPKTIGISASKIREFMIDGDLESFKKYTPQALWDEFDELRGAVLSSQSNTDTSSI